MNTRIMAPTPEALSFAGALIRSARLVAFPTETVYGLGASALDDTGVARIFAAKGRPADNPLIVHVASPDDARFLVEWTKEAGRAAGHFWPGPLTLVLPARNGRGTIAVRQPDHPVAEALLRLAKRPIAAPSANASGRPSPTEASHVEADLGGIIPLILDGGPTGFGVESTVLDLASSRPTILRPGGVTPVMLGEAGIPAVVERTVVEGASPRAPGMKYRHYRPNVPVVTLVAAGRHAGATLSRWALEITSHGVRPAVLAFDRDAAGAWPSVIFSSVEEMARELFRLMRTFEHDADVILVEAPEPEGIGLAVVNRLEKASSVLLAEDDPLPEEVWRVRRSGA